MNIKLTESEYQQMIIALIYESIIHIEDLRMADDDGDLGEWIYFIQRMKIKGVLNDIRSIREVLDPKSRKVAKDLRNQFLDKIGRNITTII